VLVRQSRPHLNTLRHLWRADRYPKATASGWVTEFRGAGQMSDSCDDPTLLDRVNGLSFDQMAISDHEVMVGADVFSGVLQSNFSALIAFARGARKGTRPI